jgi:hypothetical protein
MHFATERGAAGRAEEALVPPDGELEALIAGAMADVLKRPEGVSVTADFFEGLGGDSLTAAMLVTLLREDWRTDWVTVSDIYDARTVRGLAARAPEPVESTADAALPLVREGRARPLLANLVQGGWLALSVLAALVGLVGRRVPGGATGLCPPRPRHPGAGRAADRPGRLPVLSAAVGGFCRGRQVAGDRALPPLRAPVWSPITCATGW